MRASATTLPKGRLLTEGAYLLVLPFRSSIVLTYIHKWKIVTMYINGKVDAVCPMVVTLNPAILGAQPNAYIGKSLNPTDPYLAGSVENFWWFDGVIL